MKAIEAAMKAMFDTPYTDRDDVFLIGLDAYLDGILADPEAMERITRDADNICRNDRENRKSPYQAAIAALKQEAER